MAQLSLGYTTKQIYDKHKIIWWECVNPSQIMTRDDFIWFQNITYLDLEHKKGSWCLHTNLAISIWSWIFQHSKDVFFSQDVDEINGIQLHSPTQCDSILLYAHNGAISMDATFGTNDMKFHLFTLMGFDDHCRSVLLV
jgi:hypothetical protein